MEYVQKHFSKEHLRALQNFLCALISQLVCTLCLRGRPANIV